ncbi:PBECR4 domain-containing protein [Paenilisteria weihenstephanensis]|uniref:PBECR4 domain-containing protein n=1 Tax=Listeria weihenstephanensis TaxID=1006155 RepID=UPI002D80A17F|nr:PBECR4 domain-containing protein [Listeria weihenstephanensis]
MHFVNKRVIYVYKEKQTIKQFEIYMTATNFMHLCGVQYRHGAASFYNDITNKTLRLNDVILKKDGTTKQKLQVLPLLHELVGEHVKVCLCGSYLMIWRLDLIKVF